MRDRLHIVLRIASAALVFAGYLALGSVYQYGISILLLPLVLLPLTPLGAWLERRFQAWRVLRRAVAVAYLVFIPFSVSMLGLMDAVIALVIFIQTWLLLGEKSARIWYEIYLMAFFMLLAAVVQAPEPLIAIALLLFGVAAVWAFAALRMQIELERCPVRTRPELRPIGGGALAIKQGNMVDLGLVFTLSGLSVLSLLLTVAFFLLTPRVEAGWLGRRDERQAITGLSETVRLLGDASIYEDETVVMHVRFPDEPEGIFLPESDLYWRVATLTRFSQDEWSRRGLQYHYVPNVPELINRAVWSALRGTSTREERQERPGARTVRQVIYMDDVPTQGMPALDLPCQIQLLSEQRNIRVAWDGANDFSLQLQMRGTRRLQYEVRSDMVAHTREALRAAPFDYDYVEPRDYSMLTYHELLPETQTLARDLTADHESVYDKVMALNDWLGGEDFLYSLSVPPLPPVNGIDHFILQARRGHCELFASALALMARSLGIPARVVSGYRGGGYNPNDQAYLVRASMAHLWVEVLLNGVGWVRVDPSPRSDLAPTGLRRLQMAWSVYVLRGKMFWYQSVIGFDSGIRLDRLRWPWQRRPRSSAPPMHEAPADATPADGEEILRDYAALFSHPIVRLAALSALLIGGAGAWRAWRRLQTNMPKLSTDQRRARRLYRRFLRKASARGIVCDNLTAEEVVEALNLRRFFDQAATESFIAWYHAVRFGGRSLSKTQQQEFARFIRGL